MTVFANFAPSPTQGRSGVTLLPASRTRKWIAPSVNVFSVNLAHTVFGEPHGANLCSLLGTFLH